MENVIIELLTTIADALGNNNQNKSREELLICIKQEDEKMFSLCKDFILAWDAWLFSRQDMQLHLKAPDLFKTQKKVLLENLVNKGNVLHIEALRMDIDIKPFLKTFDFEIQ
jgi:hypothetical protein